MNFLKLIVIIMLVFASFSESKLENKKKKVSFRKKKSFKNQLIKCKYIEWKHTLICKQPRKTAIHPIMARLDIIKA